MAAGALRVAAAAVLAGPALVLTACDREAPPAAPRPPSAATPQGGAPRIEADWSAVGGSGHVYLQVSTDAGRRHYEIVRVDVAAGEAEQITAIGGPFGVSQFSVSSAGLVLAQAPTSADELALMLPDGSLEPLDPARGSAPEINDAGRIIAERPAGRGWQVMLRTAGGGWRPLAPAGGWSNAVWLDEERIALLRVTGDGTTWRTVSRSGEVGSPTSLAPAGYLPGSYSRPADQPLLLQPLRRRDPLVLWRPGRAPVAVAATSGWGSGCLSPDGSRLLLIGREGLGVKRLDVAGAPVTIIGDPVPRVLACGWVQERFGPPG